MALVRSLYRQTLRQAAVFGMVEASRQLALARFAEFLPPGVMLRADGNDVPTEVVRESFRLPVESQSDAISRGFDALRAMLDDEMDITLQSLWVTHIVPPRKAQQVPVVATRASSGVRFLRGIVPSSPPMPLAPKAMVREMRVLLILSCIMRWAQLHYKARLANGGSSRPSTAELLSTLPFETPFPTLTHAVNAEMARVTDKVQRRVDGYAQEVVRRLDSEGISVTAAARATLFAAEGDDLPSPSIDEELPRINSLRENLERVFQVILDVCVAGESATPVEHSPSCPLPLSIVACEAPENLETQIHDIDMPDYQRAAQRAVETIRLHTLDNILVSDEAAESVVAAFVMSVAVRIGLRRVRLVRRTPPGAENNAEPRFERYAIFVDGPIACEGRGSITGPLVVDVVDRSILRAQDSSEEAGSVEASEIPVPVPMGFRRVAVALLRRMRRERKPVAKLEVDDADSGDASTLSTTEPVADEPLLPGGFNKSPHFVRSDPGDDRGDRKTDDVASATPWRDDDGHLRDDPEGANDALEDDDFNALPVDADAEVDESVERLGTVMPPKVLASHLCTRLLFLGARQNLRDRKRDMAGAANAPTSSVTFVSTATDGTLTKHRAPDPAILSEAETWRLLRSQVLFINQLP